MHWPQSSCSRVVSYVEMEIKDRLDDAKALVPILVTVDAMHTLAILWSSRNESSGHNKSQQYESMVGKSLTSISIVLHRRPASMNMY